MAKRALRIFPGLFVAALLSAFVLAPFVTTLEPGAYFSRPEPYRYVIGNTLLDQTVHELPGVMFVNNPVGLEINGSMWTLRLEFMMYLMVLGLGVTAAADLAHGTARSAGAAVSPACSLNDARFPWRMGLAARLFRGRHGPLQIARDPHLRRPRSTPGAGRPRPQRATARVHRRCSRCSAVIWRCGWRSTRVLPVIPAARFGDLSYGLYIYGWPVEQAVVWLLGGRALWWQVLALALPATAALAFLSWHLVERRALQLKPGARPVSASAPSPAAAQRA